ncbi:hypothetical protein ABNG30_20795 [Bacillus thuringiensis]
MARTLHTKVIMDSGKEYDLDVHPEDFMSRISNEKGELYKGFVHFLTFQ